MFCYEYQVSHNPNTAEIPTPTWKELTGIDGNGKMGKILVPKDFFFFHMM